MQHADVNVRAEGSTALGTQYHGTVAHPFGIVEVWGYERNNDGSQEWVFRAVVDGDKVWGSFDRPRSRALSLRGVGIIAGRWLKDLYA